MPDFDLESFWKSSCEDTLSKYEITYPGVALQIMIPLAQKRLRGERDFMKRPIQIINDFGIDASTRLIYDTLAELGELSLIKKVTDRRRYVDYMITDEGIDYVVSFNALHELYH